MRFSGRSLSAAELFVYLRLVHPHTPVRVNNDIEVTGVEVDAECVRIEILPPDGLDSDIVGELLDDILTVSRSVAVKERIDSFRQANGIEP